MNIRIYPDPILQKSSSEIKNIDKGLVDLINSMVNTMREAEGIGLAAPQVGVLKRVFVCQDFSDESKETFLTMINPKIIDTEGRVESKEGCLSIPGYYDYVYRAEKIQIEALDINGKSKTYLTDGMQSIVFQHEYDHLDGILFPYRMSQIKRDIFMKKINREFK
ncbi:peptide deformylase [bacterium]|nr:peptide deformylase [bacterium]MBT3850127.1 peptide deformylase [bacterium]